jgi:hypothetical protein
MPLKPNTSKKNREANFHELVTAPVGKTRHKAIATIMKRRKVDYETARKIQAAAITRK